VFGVQDLGVGLVLNLCLQWGIRAPYLDALRNCVFCFWHLCANFSVQKQGYFEKHLLRINTLLLVSGLILKLSDIEPVIPEFNTELRAIS
jgi:hypothetical protein